MSKTENKIVQEVVADYLRRREDRRSLEAQWQLNINFMMGNQYSYISSNGVIREDEKRYFWQEKSHNDMAFFNVCSIYILHFVCKIFIL